MVKKLSNVRLTAIALMVGAVLAVGRRHMYRLIRATAVIALALMAWSPASAQSDGSEAKVVSKADKSGTNPINFTNDLRAYYEYQNLRRVCPPFAPARAGADKRISSMGPAP